MTRRQKPRTCAAPDCDIVLGYGPHGPHVACHRHNPPTRELADELWRAYHEWLTLDCPRDGLAHDEYTEARDALLAYVDRWHGSGRAEMLRERAEANALLRERVAAFGLVFDDEHVAANVRGDWPGGGANCLSTRAAMTIHAAGVPIPARLLADRPELQHLTDAA